MQFVQGDLQSLDLLNYILSAEDIDTVMHFAAQVSYIGVSQPIFVSFLCVRANGWVN